jgi:hypothetical protein
MERSQTRMIKLLCTIMLTPFLSGCVERRSDERTPVIMPFATAVVNPDRIRVLENGKVVDIKNDYYAFDAAKSESKELYLDNKLVFTFPVPQGLRTGRRDFATVHGDHLRGTVSRDGERKTPAGYNDALLKDGRFFISGGVIADSEGPPIGNTWLFDPRTKKLLNGPDLISPRCNHFSDVLRDGRVLINGGENPSYQRTVTAIEIYDPRTNTIEKVCDLNKPRTFHRTIELNDGKILVISGETREDIHDAGETLTSTVELVDLEKKTATIVGQLHNARRSFGVVPVGNSGALIFGGEMDGYFDVPGESSVLTVELYDGKVSSTN